MNPFLRRYRTNLFWLIAAALSVLWGLWQGLPCWQAVSLLGVALLLLVLRLSFDRLQTAARIRRVQRWCRLHHWTDLFLHDRQFYAFPPQAVMPLPLPAAAVNSSTLTGMGRTLQQGWFLLIAVVILASLVTLCLELLLALGLLVIHILH